MANQPKRGFFGRMFRRNQPQMAVAVPSTNAIAGAFNRYITNAVKINAPARNINNVKKALNELINSAGVAAAAPIAGEPRGTSNLGLTQKSLNLKNAMNRLNTAEMKNLTDQITGIRRKLQNTGVKVTEGQLSNINKNVARATRLLSANDAAITAIKAFLAATKSSNNKNANTYRKNVNAAYQAIPNTLRFLYAKNKTNANAIANKLGSKAGAQLLGGPGSGPGSQPPSGPPTNLLRVGNKYLKLTNTNKGWYRSVTQNNSWQPSNRNKTFYNKNGNPVGEEAA